MTQVNSPQNTLRRWQLRHYFEQEISLHASASPLRKNESINRWLDCCIQSCARNWFSSAPELSTAHDYSSSASESSVVERYVGSIGERHTELVNSVIRSGSPVKDLLPPLRFQHVPTVHEVPRHRPAHQSDICRTSKTCSEGMAAFSRSCIPSRPMAAAHPMRVVEKVVAASMPRTATGNTKRRSLQKPVTPQASMRCYLPPRVGQPTRSSQNAPYPHAAASGKSRWAQSSVTGMNSSSIRANQVEAITVESMKCILPTGCSGFGPCMHIRR